MFTVLLCMLMSTWLESNSASGEVKSNQLVELAETARKNSSGCGPLAVWYTLGRLGHPTSVDALIASSDLDEQGTTVGCLLKMLAERGCPGRAIRTHSNRLCLLPVPSILIVDKGTHCVVYDGMDDQRRVARIFETTSKEVRLVELGKLQRAWTGEAIVFDRPYPSPYAFCAVVHLCDVHDHRAGGMFGNSPQIGDNGGTEEVLHSRSSCSRLALLGFCWPPYCRQFSRDANPVGQRNVAAICAKLVLRCTVMKSIFASYRPPLYGNPLVSHWTGDRGAGSIDRVSLGLVTSMQPDRVYANWAVALLPFLGEEGLYGSFDLDAPIALRSMKMHVQPTWPL